MAEAYRVEGPNDGRGVWGKGTFSIEGPTFANAAADKPAAERRCSELNAAYAAGRASPPGGVDVEAATNALDALERWFASFTPSHPLYQESWVNRRLLYLLRTALASTPTVADVDARYARLIKAAENLRAEWTPKYIANSPLLCAVVDVITALAALAGGEVGNG